MPAHAQLQPVAVVQQHPLLVQDLLGHLGGLHSGAVNSDPAGCFAVPRPVAGQVQLEVVVLVVLDWKSGRFCNLVFILKSMV